MGSYRIRSYLTRFYSTNIYYGRVTTEECGATLNPTHPKRNEVRRDEQMVKQYPSVYLLRKTAVWLEEYCNRDDVESRNSVVVNALDSFREDHQDINRGEDE